MTKVRVHTISVSLDGYMAGPNQNLDNPIGEGGRLLHEWIFETRAAREMHGRSGGDEGLDDDLLREGFDKVGATIMGRNMFGPVRGEWTEPRWDGWWGDDPPFPHPVFVLTHHPREPLEMAGGTTFYFVTDGVETALELARAAAGDGDVIVGGGASTIHQLLRSRAVDELHIAVVPVFLGAGERLFNELDGAMDDYTCLETITSSRVTHYRVARAEAAR
jgi:dihydrofolate reductase